MKFLQQHQIKNTDKLFKGIYKYKVVISSGVAGWFRGADLEKVERYIEEKSPYNYYSKNAGAAERSFGKKIYDFLKTKEIWHCRVETPYLSIYLNDFGDLQDLIKLSSKRIKYISIPDPASESKLVSGTVLVKKLDFDFRVVVGATHQNYSNFVQWSNNNPKIRLPKRAVKDLSKDYSPGGSYFYVKDAKSLTLVKMFLGRTITKIETVVQA